MNKKNISVVSFVRRSLGVKGKTWHNGRGVFICEFSCKVSDLVEKMREKLEGWKKKNLIEVVNEDERYVEVVFKDLFKCEYYRSVFFIKDEKVKEWGVGMRLKEEIWC